MQTLARGNSAGDAWGESASAVRDSRRRSAGFTLIEMLVVLMIAGLLIAVVTLAPARNRRMDLDEEAQRLATMLESANDDAQIRSVSIAWQPSDGGYAFYERTESGAWRPLVDDLLKPYHWAADVTGVAIHYTGSSDSTARVVFGDESINVPVTVTLSSGGARLQVVSSGVGNFAVQRP